MLTKKKILALVILWAIFAVTCFVVLSNKENREDKEEKKDDNYILKLTDDDINGNHIKLDLSENVTVDADITPISKYREGVDIYYTKRIDDNMVTYKKYKKNPTVFNQPLMGLVKMIEDNSSGKFSINKMTTKKNSKNSFSCYIPYVNNNNNKGSFLCDMDTDEKKQKISEYVSFTSCLADWDKDGMTSDSISKIALGLDLLLASSGLDEPELSFGSKSEIGDKMLGLIRDITKSGNYSDYQCVVINDKTFSAVFKNKSIYRDIEVKTLDTEHYVFFFPFKINGLEWKSSESTNLFSDLREAEGLEFADDIAFSDMGLTALNASEQAIAYNDNGIVEMELSNGVEVSDAYKEKQKVIPLNDIVNIVQEYFNGKSRLPTKIYNIKLCYTGMFTSPDDGKIRNIAKPYWCVEYTQKKMTGYDEYNTLFIDVTTGDVYS